MCEPITMSILAATQLGLSVYGKVAEHQEQQQAAKLAISANRNQRGAITSQLQQTAAAAADAQERRAIQGEAQRGQVQAFGGHTGGTLASMLRATSAQQARDVAQIGRNYDAERAQSAYQMRALNIQRAGIQKPSTLGLALSVAGSAAGAGAQFAAPGGAGEGVMPGGLFGTKENSGLLYDRFKVDAPKPAAR